MRVWKWLFILLLAVNVLTIAGLYLFLSGDYEEEALVPDETSEDTESEQLMTAENQTVEFLLNHFLQEESGTALSVSVDEENIQLMSENEYLNMNFDTIFNLEPHVTENELIFEISDISVGSLPLSEDMLYTLIRTTAELPEGMTFSTEAKALLIDKPLFNDVAGLSVDIERIDYRDNAWYFSIEN